MGDDSEETCRAMLQRAVRVVAEKRLDCLFIGYVQCQEPLFRLAARDFPSWYCRDWAITASKHWALKLPESFDSFLKGRSKKHRYWLKRLPRVLEETFPQRVKIEAFRDPQGFDIFYRDARTVFETSYQRRIGGAFGADDSEMAKSKLSAERGAFRGYILYIDGCPCSYWLTTVYHDVLHLNQTGYDPRFRKFELGTILLMRVLADHCGTPVREADFGPGEEGYKERFGDYSFSEASVRIYRPCARTVFANALMGLNAKLSGGGELLLAKLGLFQRVKRILHQGLSG